MWKLEIPEIRPSKCLISSPASGAAGDFAAAAATAVLGSEVIRENIFEFRQRLLGAAREGQRSPAGGHRRTGTVGQHTQNECGGVQGMVVGSHKMRALSALETRRGGAMRSRKLQSCRRRTLGLPLGYLRVESPETAHQPFGRGPFACPRAFSMCSALAHRPFMAHSLRLSTDSFHELGSPLVALSWCTGRLPRVGESELRRPPPYRP